MTRNLLLAAFLITAACTEWPDLPSGAGVDAAAWPTLRPLEDVLPPEGAEADPQVGDITARADRLQSRGEVLRGRVPAPTRVSSLNERAELLRRPVDDEAAFDALRESLRR